MLIEEYGISYIQVKNTRRPADLIFQFIRGNISGPMCRLEPVHPLDTGITFSEVLQAWVWIDLGWRATKYALQSCGDIMTRP